MCFASLQVGGHKQLPVSGINVPTKTIIELSFTTKESNKSGAPFANCNPTAISKPYNKLISFNPGSLEVAMMYVGD